MANTWIVTTTPQISSLVALGRGTGGQVVVVAVGEFEVRGADRVLSVALAGDQPAEAMAPAVAEAVAAEPGDLVLAPNRPAERVLAAAVAFRLGAPVVADLMSVSSRSAEVSRFGGITQQTVSFDSVLVAIADGGAACEGAEAPTEPVPGSGYPAAVISLERAEAQQVNLSAARRIVAAGRGFKTQDELALASDLAAAIGAEVACSRPLAEGNGWLPRDRYIGVSGQHVAPDLYIAAGISGQIQHTAGMRDSKVVVAVNSDPNAPIFQLADYGIVGDLREVLPRLTAAAG